MKWTRRRVAGALLGGAAVITGAWKFGDRLGSGGEASPVPADEARYLQVIAHPDDDLYFMNPDLADSLQGGRPHLTVCITCGEADGKNVNESDPGLANAQVDYAGYAAARFAGWRRAYAAMALGTPNAAWSRDTVATAGGPVAEIDTLIGAPHVRLMILNCWNNGSNSPLRNGRIDWLWSGEHDKLPTMCPAGGPVRDTYTYTRAGMLSTLLGMVTDFQPTLVRVLDPDPDYQVHDAAHPQYSDSGDYSDHSAHTAAALFTFAALQEWWRRGQGTASTVESYRGYYNRRWPANLSERARATKERYLAIYACADDECRDPQTQGDRKLGTGAVGTGYGQGTTRRYPPPPTWLGHGDDGRLAAFAVLGGQAVMWAESEPGSGLPRQPRPLGGGPLLPQLSVARLRDGRWQVVGLRMTLDADPAKQARDVVTLSCSSQAGPLGNWQNLGNPYATPDVSPLHRRGVGIPVAAVREDGRVQVFARNYFKGLSSRLQRTDGGWGRWLDLAGTETQDGLAVCDGAGTGPAQVFATARGGILWWRQNGNDGAFDHEVIGVDAPAGPPTVERLPDGRLIVLVRGAGTGALLAYLQQRQGGPWDTTPSRLGGNGLGAVGAATLPDGRLFVAIRDDDGHVSVGLVAPGKSPGDAHWTRVDAPFVVGTPAVAVVAKDQAMVAAVAASGTLWTGRYRV